MPRRKVLIVDREFSGVMKEALALATVKPLVIDYDDPQYRPDAPYPEGRAHRHARLRGIRCER